MQVTLSKQELIDFEEDIVQSFEKGLIRAPIHLYSGNEDQMIDIFKNHIEPSDWLCCTWRSHYQCLLKGVPKDRLKADILAGKSISLCYPEYNIISSAIVGGIIPIATGIAMGLKRSGSKNKVACFVGDMTALTGTFHENLNYCMTQDLPIVFVVEDNNKSVCTNTLETWGYRYPFVVNEDEKVTGGGKLLYYRYTSKYPHAGGLKRVQF